MFTRHENLVFLFNDSISLTVYTEVLAAAGTGILLPRCLLRGSCFGLAELLVCLLLFTDALRPLIKKIETLFMNVAPPRTLTAPCLSAPTPTSTLTPLPRSIRGFALGEKLRSPDIRLKFSKSESVFEEAERSALCHTNIFLLKMERKILPKHSFPVSCASDSYPRL